jgi:hypothetical protein
MAQHVRIEQTQNGMLLPSLPQRIIQRLGERIVARSIPEIAPLGQRTASIRSRWP